VKVVRGELVAIDQINFAAFAADYQEVRIWPGLIRQQHDASGPQISVVRLHAGLIERGEVIDC
jgi:hypothetical protein